jgi:glutaconyl-CoA/methylmalonyl-CoA decarboxylase subunit delta
MTPSLFTYVSSLAVIDRQAGIIVVVGYSVVFAALIILYLVFKYLLPLIFRIKLYHRAAREGRAIDENERHEMSGEVNAAIATAIYLYFNEQHDYESNIITIRKVSRNYSPWNSKIYNMRNTPK